MKAKNALGESLHQSLHFLTQHQRYGAARHMAETLLQRRPEDVTARYHLGILKVLMGEGIAGIEDLVVLIRDHLGMFLTSPDPEMKLLLGRCALQLASIAELALTDERREELLLYVEFGSRLGAEVARMVGATGLRAAAAELQRRVVRVGGGEGAAGLCHVPDSPKLLQVEPTNHCTLGCGMCPRQRMGRSKGYLTPELWEGILASWQGRRVELALPLLFHPEQVVFNLHSPGTVKFFFLGEPLLHREAPAMIARGREAGCLVSIQTNGTLLADPGMRRRLLSSRPHEIGISIDGWDEAGFELLRRGHDWATLVASVRALHEERAALGLGAEVALGVSAIMVDAVPDWRRRIGEFLEPILPWVDRVGLIPLDRRREPLFLDAEGRLVPHAREASTGGGTAVGGPVGGALCAEPLNKLNVLWDGRVTACCHDIDGEVLLGRVEEAGGIDGVWMGERARGLRQALIGGGLDGHPLCRACLGLSPLG
ncbi:MAG: radical SAM protein [Magnetococcales bacterium]|nr:radical SAM protein [Magnetococcales bacterium]